MTAPSPIFLFTDFGLSGPYVGQMKGAILDRCPGCAVVDLMHDAPAMQPRLAAYLLSAICGALPKGAIVVAVVDPGVGGERDALLIRTAELTLVGPDNGLLSRLHGICEVERVDWRPDSLSSSFHGRDLFAPLAATLAAGETLAATSVATGDIVGADWPADTAEILYVDAYGNLMSGIRAEKVNKNKEIIISGQVIRHAETFCRVPPGELFWYSNSQGLLEIAANRASAASCLPLALGDRILLD